jgi:hypothetical protein
MLSDEEIQDIRNRAKLNDNRQIEPMAFARDIERAALAKVSKQCHDGMAQAFNAHIESIGGADSNAWHAEPADEIFYAGYRAGQKASKQPKHDPVAWESITECYTKYITHSNYEKLSDVSKKWYKPYKCTKCCESADKQEPVGYVVVGQGISFYKTTLEEANHQANSLEWRDDKNPIIYPVFKSYPIALDQKEIWFRKVEVQGYPVEHLVMSYKGAGDVGPFYSAPVQAPPQIASIPDGYVHVDEVIQLCEDFSSRSGSIYIGDVQAALSGLSAAPKPEGE